ncbi:FAD-dependent oxidoreductase [Lachnospiraceae bacterium 62-35]
MPLITQGRYDVAVCGGGVAGTMAAISAARQGARAVLIEKGPFLGGVLAMGYFPHSFYANTGKKAIGGIAEELIQRLIQTGGSLGHLRYEGGHLYTITPVDSELVKIELIKMAKEAGVDVFFETIVNNVIMEDKRVKGVMIQNKEGTELLEAEMIIDATGDGDIACMAGAPYEKGRKRDGKMQPVSLAMRVSNVDTKKMAEEVPSDQAVLMVKRPGSDTEYPVYFVARLGKWDDTSEAKELFTDKNHQMFCLCTLENDIYLNISRVIGVDGTQIRESSKALMDARLQIEKLYHFIKKYIPGFEKCHLIGGTFLGVRESRRFIGNYTLTGEDIREGKKFEDNICLVGYPMDMHDPDGGNVVFKEIGGDGTYGIPLRCLTLPGYDNLMVAGRCISVTHEALASARTMSACMCMGQAAGTAAAMVCGKKDGLKELSVPELQEKLKQQGAILE